MLLPLFAIRKDAKGREYVYQAPDELDKNHREGTDNSVTEARYKVSNKKTLKYYMYICVFDKKHDIKTIHRI